MADNDAARSPIDLSNSDLEALPDGLTCVYGDLVLNHCQHLKQLPGRLTVLGSLSLQGCVRLEGLPEYLRVTGTLRLAGCLRLQSLPENLEVGGTLIIRRCHELEEIRQLPPAPHVTISLCDKLRRLASTKGGHNHFEVYACPSLTELPESLESTDYLGLVGLPRVTRLRGAWRSRWRMNLHGLSALEVFPEDIETGLLTLPDCRRVLEWPRRVQTRWGVDVAHARLTRLPSCLRGHHLLWKGAGMEDRFLAAPETITLDEILTASTAEFRMFLLECYGWDQFVQATGAEVLGVFPEWPPPESAIRIAYNHEVPSVWLRVRGGRGNLPCTLLVPPRLLPDLKANAKAPDSLCPEMRGR